MKEGRVMIKVSNLDKEYIKTQKVLSNVNIHVEEGEIFGLLGPNGAGKSTLIKILTTIEKVTAGECSLNGFDVSKEPLKARMQFGVVSQDLTIDSRLTARDNLYLTARYYHIQKNKINQLIDESLQIVNLLDMKDKMVATFSGGMKKRLDIAAALMHNPKIIFLDEPTVGLDVKSRMEIWSYIRHLVNEYKVTVFLTTHYMDEADSLCDRVAIFDKGIIKKIDTPANLKREMQGDLIIIKVKEDNETIKEVLEKEEYIKSVNKNQEKYYLLVNSSEECIPKVFQSMRKAGITIELLSSKKPTLEDVFMTLTGNVLENKGFSPRSFYGKGGY
jgi:ABC-2 type transport system ATP-binding protein